MGDPIAIHSHSDQLQPSLEFLKRTRWELRELRKVRVWREQLQIFDVNGDYFEIRGAGYLHPDIIELLRALNTAFDPVTIHEPIKSDYKEFLTGRRHPWAHDRVL
jgi:hypothetical protein